MFLGTVLTLMIIVGTLMYLIEGEQSGFTSIPQGVCGRWYHDDTVGTTSLRNTARQDPSLIVMIGYGIIAVPTGIVSVEIAEGRKRPVSTQACPECSVDGHDADARFCKFCGAHL